MPCLPKEKSKEAIDHYNQAIRITPDYVGVYNNRGNAYANLGQYKLAFEDYNQAIRLNPDFADAYYNWGLLTISSASISRRLTCYGQAIRLNPNYVKAYINRGVAYLLRGNQKLGCPDAQKGVRIGKLQIVRNGKRTG
ncbi:MAG: tetratricopeptide repeat protein [Ignavibacteriales bacterium]|nr:tetratricopeptide repeat protein [Ignavibacteriales bacterium]